MKKGQKEIVKDLLNQRGVVSNFYCINNKITIRLGAIIHLLTQEGWEFNSYYGKEKGFKKEYWKNYYYEVKNKPHELEHNQC